MGIKIEKATKESRRARILVSGPSGGGKTYSALKMAKGFGDKICVIDTENRSSLIYADRVASFDVIELNSFHPRNYIEALEAVENNGPYDVVVIDTISPAWHAVQEVHAQISGGDEKKSYQAWAKVNPIHYGMFSRFRESTLHVICTCRSKEGHFATTDAFGKMVVRKIPIDFEQRGNPEYEFDVSLRINDDHTFTESKSRSARPEGLLFGTPDKICEEHGKIIKEFYGDGVDPSITKKQSDTIKELAPLKGMSMEDVSKMCFENFSKKGSELTYFEADEIIRLLRPAKNGG